MKFSMRTKGVLCPNRVLAPKIRSSSSGFTLAEMMVVMLILSIIMAAFAPVMTTRSKVDLSSPWRWSSNNSDIYYGIGDSQSAMIGQRKKKSGDLDSRLVINTSSAVSGQKHILFKHGGDASSSETLGYLSIDNSNNLVLGNSSPTGKSNVAIGYKAMSSLPSGDNNTAIGANANLSTVAGDNSTALGAETYATGNSTSIGYTAKAIGDSTAIGINAQALMQSIAIGNESYATLYALALGDTSKASGNNSTSLGNSTVASGKTSVAIGYNASASGDSSTSLGGSSNASSSYSTAVGYNSKAKNTWASAYGYASDASGYISTSIGHSSTASGARSTALGYNASSSGTLSLSIGDSYSYGDYSIAIGDRSISRDDSSIALGRNSESSNGGIAIGEGASADGVRASGTIRNDLRGIAIGYDAIADGGIAIGGSEYFLGAPITATNAGQNSVAIGYGAQAKNANTVAIGVNACQYATGMNKVCIGAGSGPKSGDSWASDNVERIFIGGRSKFNDGAAIMELHNDSGKQHTITNGRGLSNTTVVINGALLVKGGIITSMAWVDDREFDSDGGVNMIGRTGGQLEPLNLDWDGRSDQVSGYYGSSERGYFKSPNSWNPYVPSDKRLKYIGSENTSGLDKIRELKVFNYTFKKDKKQTPHVGVIAQDLQKVFPDAVTKNSRGYFQIRLEDMFYALINAVKELDTKLSNILKNDNLQDLKIKSLERQNEELKAANKALEARLERLEQRLK